MKLEQFIQTLLGSDQVIEDSRYEVLDSIVNYLLAHKQDAKLLFVCTHNSRRSQLAQVWAAKAASHFNVSIQSFSGGTEVTAFNQNAVDALADAGFNIQPGEDNNPRHQIEIDQNYNLEMYSKRFDDASNPKESFCAIMTCSEADADCPFVPGADKRISLHYQDPKVSDGSGEEKRVYGERSLQIAQEMFYIFNKVSQIR